MNHSIVEVLESSDDLLQPFREDPDAISKIEILQCLPDNITWLGVPIGTVLPDITLIVHCTNGKQWVVRKEQAEAILNDGGLMKRGIPIVIRLRAVE